MRALWFLGPGSLEWREVSEPTLQGPGEALVRPVVAAACDLDAAVVRGQAPLPGPYAFGHEFVAEVTDVGGEVTSVRPGDLVVVPFQIACGECARCLRGLTGSCTRVKNRSMYGFGALGGEGWGGGIADVVRVPFADAMLVRLPEGVPAATVASGSDNLPDAWRTVGPPLAAAPGAPVLVVAGWAPSIGVFAAGMAVALGSERVDYLDRNAERLRLAEALGANAIEAEAYPRWQGRYPITVDASGDPAGLSCALRSTEPGGVCTSIGIYYQGDVAVPLLQMYDVGVTFVTGRVNARAVLPSVLRLVAGGSFHPERLNTVVLWDEAPDALVDPPVKLVLSREGSDPP